MPFTMDGTWIPTPSSSPKKPVQIRLLKRKQSVVTSICNLPLSQQEKEALASLLKKQLGCGGSVKDDTLEIQGDKVQAVTLHLKKIGLLR